jgi:integrase
VWSQQVRVGHAECRGVTARALAADDWVVSARVTTRWVIRAPASAATHNKYRDLLSAVFDFAVRQGWLESNPMSEVDRMSTRAMRQRILRREDFYTPDEVENLLKHALTVLHEAFWLCGAHAGLRLPGEALGLR